MSVYDWRNEVEDEYEIERGHTVYQCFVEYHWEDSCDGYDEEGFPIGYKAELAIDSVEVGAWWDIDQDGHPTGAQWESLPIEGGDPVPMVPLLGGFTEQERKKFEDDMFDKAAAGAEAAYERRWTR